ncbi:transcriptional regulator [Rathayibacter rathayi]|uniref:Transcriptional regulator n=1 Tax=Rathayibacter rathayi TaxID=33887 RepID=A0ABX5A7J4_RATRA|nr:GAF and ANTAR domain-containing protein [Rathayibacter rathayi]PPF18160.1 transcriptional regulator [Rathayibacter rathayi]PPF41686.1 transcriptional regulator [Rathayibacter rathayi]PPF72988.1 transcriptional regulator [Rathayibacter rathayi]PPG07488.1 transcriptional regulator [Rathayibacter rathayi]PPG36841.1 transcriptional regulator [Rathayibacter rathayi]
MVTKSRERSVIRTFVALSDTLVDDYDIVDFTQTLVENSATLFDAVSAGLVLADSSGSLEVLASTDEDARLIELLQLDSGSGPCIECFEIGRPVTVADVRSVGAEWAEFRERAIELNVLAAHCVPMRSAGTTIGSLNLFQSGPGRLDPDDIAVVQAFADVATIGILHQRALQQSTVTQEQLQRALDSRVLIEQAKGVLAYAHHTTVEQAFEVLRVRSRATSTPITTLAQEIIRDYRR